MSPPASDHATSRHLARRLGWLVLPALAAMELMGHAVVHSRVTPEEDWRAAARFVRKHHQPRDATAVAPEWAEPLLREHLGDTMSLREAGRSDLALFERLWVLSIRGHRSPEAPERSADFEQRFGRVHVRRWSLGPSPVIYDFVTHVRDARVAYVQNGRSHRCRWRRAGFRARGLEWGAAWPAHRFVCDPRRPWLWVGPTVTEDLSFEARRCIWQHPQGREPVRVTFPDVPLGKRLVFYGGLYSEHERKERRGRPVHVVVEVDGRPVGRMVHREGEGWERMVARTHPGVGRETKAQRGDVTIEVTAPRPRHRSFCWSATIRKGSRR